MNESIQKIIEILSKNKPDYNLINNVIQDTSLFNVSDQKIILPEEVCRKLMNLTSKKTYPTFIMFGNKREDGSIIFNDVFTQKTKDNSDIIYDFFKSTNDKVICYGKIINNNNFDINHLNSYIDMLNKYPSLNKMTTLSMFITKSQDLNFYKYKDNKLYLYPVIYTVSRYKQEGELPSYNNREVDRSIKER